MKTLRLIKIYQLNNCNHKGYENLPYHFQFMRAVGLGHFWLINLCIGWLSSVQFFEAHFLPIKVVSPTMFTDSDQLKFF